MTKKGKPIIKAVLLGTLLCLSAAAQPHTITGKVVGVSDGDTITVLDEQKRQHKIRLDGIDAPESSQDFGSRSKQSLSDLVFGRVVTVASSKKDRYGRTVSKVTLDGRNINLEQINRGMAWFYRAYARELSRDDAVAYERAENDAKAGKRGLWADPSPTPPWEFRRGGRTAKAPAPAPATAAAAAGSIIGNRNSKIYHLPNCPDYNKVSERNRVPFASEAAAQAAGYRKARNCPP
jgi:endonuclease YncB( thermonuclease family)